MNRVSCSYLIFIFMIVNNNANVLTNNNIGPVKVIEVDISSSASVLNDNPDNTVPPLWHFGEKSYYLGTVFKANFFEAEQFCNLHGMHLVSILSNEENVFLGEKLYDNDFLTDSDLFWTSGTKLADEDHWVWLTTGTRISFTNWAPGKPDNAGKLQYCLEINRYRIARKRDVFWSDQTCATKNYFICELSRPSVLMKL